jgi:hypothetical protein
VPPEQLLLASLLQAFYGLRSERPLLEQPHDNLLFRWFVGLSPDSPIWHPTTFTKNRERLLNKGTSKNWPWRGLGLHLLQLLQWVSLASPRLASPAVV